MCYFPFTILQIYLESSLRPHVFQCISTNFYWNLIYGKMYKLYTYISLGAFTVWTHPSKTALIMRKNIATSSNLSVLLQIIKPSRNELICPPSWQISFFWFWALRYFCLWKMKLKHLFCCKKKVEIHAVASWYTLFINFLKISHARIATFFSPKMNLQFYFHALFQKVINFLSVFFFKIYLSPQV